VAQPSSRRKSLTSRSASASCLRSSRASSRFSAGAPGGSMAIDRRRFSTSSGDHQIGHEAEPRTSVRYRSTDFHNSEESSSSPYGDLLVRRDTPVRALSGSAPRTTSVVRPANPRTLMERRGVRFPRTDGSSGYRVARRRGDDAGGERSGRVGGLPPPFPPGREHSMRVGGAPSGVIHSVHPWSSGRATGSGVLEARDIELSPARAPRPEIRRQRGAAWDRFRGFCNAH
jgi:hypothetical protein